MTLYGNMVRCSVRTFFRYDEKEWKKPKRAVGIAWRLLSDVPMRKRLGSHYNLLGYNLVKIKRRGVDTLTHAFSSTHTLPPLPWIHHDIRLMLFFMDFVFNFDPQIASRFGTRWRYYERAGSEGGTPHGSCVEMFKLYYNIMAKYAYINLSDCGVEEEDKNTTCD